MGNLSLMKNTHEQIIESEIFEQVQTEIKRRSNIEIINGKARGKGTHYSTKRTGHD
jgi:site-specific DNA recombinase